MYVCTIGFSQHSKDRDTAIRRSIFKQDIYTYVKVSVSSTDPYTVKFDKNGKRSHVEFNFEMEVHSVYRMTWDFSVVSTHPTSSSFTAPLVGVLLFDLTLQFFSMHPNAEVVRFCWRMS